MPFSMGIMLSSKNLHYMLKVDKMIRRLLLIARTRKVHVRFKFVRWLLIYYEPGLPDGKLESIVLFLISIFGVNSAFFFSMTVNTRSFIT